MRDSGSLKSKLGVLRKPIWQLRHKSSSSPPPRGSARAWTLLAIVNHSGMKSLPTLPVPFVDLQHTVSYYCTNLASPNISVLLTRTTDFILRKLCPRLNNLQVTWWCRWEPGLGNITAAPDNQVWPMPGQASALRGWACPSKARRAASKSCCYLKMIFKGEILYRVQW